MEDCCLLGLRHVIVETLTCKGRLITASLPHAGECNNSSISKLTSVSTVALFQWCVASMVKAKVAHGVSRGAVNMASFSSLVETVVTHCIARGANAENSFFEEASLRVQATPVDEILFGVAANASGEGERFKLDGYLFVPGYQSCLGTSSSTKQMQKIFHEQTFALTVN